MPNYNLLKFLDDFLKKVDGIEEKLIPFYKIEIAKILFRIDDSDLKKFETNEYFYNFLKINPSDIIEFNNSDHINIYSLNKLVDNYLVFLKEGDYCFEVLFENNYKSYLSLLNDNAYFNIYNFISPEYTSQLREQVVKISILEKYKGIAHIYGNSRMQRIWNLPLKIKYIDLLLWDPIFISVLEDFFYRNTFHQKYFLSSFQANIIYPGAADGVWHRDDNVPDPHPQWPIKLNFMIPLDDITEFNGSTEIAKKSHLFHNRIDINEINNLEKIHINSQSGSMISWTGRLWHKSSANHSNKPRIVLLIMFSSSIFKEISTEEFYGSHVLNDNGFLKFPNRFKSLIGFSHGKRLGT